MKILSIAFCLFMIAAATRAQDTLFMKTGDTIPCFLVDVNFQSVSYVNKMGGREISIATEKVKRATGRTAELVYGINSMVAPNEPRPKPPVIHVVPIVETTASSYKVGDKIEASGTLMIWAASFTLVGTALSVIGVTQDIPELAYVGAGSAGVSVFFYLGAGINMKRAGSEFKKL